MAEGVARPRGVRDDSPLRRARRRVAPAPGNAASLIAPGGNLALPRLDGIPAKLRGLDASEITCRYAAAFLRSDLFPAELWDGDPLRFLKNGLSYFLEGNGASDVARRFDLYGGIDSTIGNSYGLRNKAANPEELFISFGVGGAIGIVEVQPTFERLEGLSRGAGVSFIWKFLDAVNRWWPTWDFRDAEMMWEGRQDAYEGDLEYEMARAEKEGREVADKPESLGDLALPKEFLGRPRRLMPISGIKAAAERGTKTDRKMVNGLDELVTASRAGLSRSAPSKTAKLCYRLRESFFDGSDGPMPVFGVRMYEDDELSGLIDEFLQGSGEVDHEPAFLDVIQRPTAALVKAAMHRLGAAVATLGAAARVVDLMPGNKTTALTEGA